MTYAHHKDRTMRLLIPILISLNLVCAAARKPNVILIFTDDQGTLDAGCYGSKDLMTPNIDKLAETGVRFTQAYAHTVCCPARAALLTGRHPQRSGVRLDSSCSSSGPPRSGTLRQGTCRTAPCLCSR